MKSQGWPRSFQSRCRPPLPKSRLHEPSHRSKETASSYAGSYPKDGDIYLEAVYTVDESRVFGDPIPNTRGVLLRKEQYTYVELFSVPESEGYTDAE